MGDESSQTAEANRLAIKLLKKRGGNGENKRPWTKKDFATLQGMVPSVIQEMRDSEPQLWNSTIKIVMERARDEAAKEGVKIELPPDIPDNKEFSYPPRDTISYQSPAERIISAGKGARDGITHGGK